MKISLQYHPSAPPNMLWSAVDDDTYDGVPYEHEGGRVTRSPMGWGATEDEAKQDLLDQIADWEDEQRIKDEEGRVLTPPSEQAWERDHPSDQEIDAAQHRLEALFGKAWLEGGKS